MEIKGITMPEGLRPLARKFMEDIIGRLERNGRLDGLDNLTLYILAGNINLYLQCAEEGTDITTETARHTKQINPVFIYQKQIQGNIAVLLKEMGLTLGSRSKMKAPDREEESLADRLAAL